MTSLTSRHGWDLTLGIIGLEIISHGRDNLTIRARRGAIFEMKEGLQFNGIWISKALPFHQNGCLPFILSIRITLPL